MRNIAIAAAVLAGGFVYAGEQHMEISVSTKANSLVVERTVVEDKQRDVLSWKRYAECAKSDYTLDGMLGEHVFVLDLYKGTKNIYLNDFDCDGKVDYFFDMNAGKFHARSDENEGLFKKADKIFSEAKKELNQYVNLNKLTKEWLDNLEKQAKPKTTEIK